MIFSRHSPRCGMAVLQTLPGPTIFRRFVESKHPSRPSSFTAIATPSYTPETPITSSTNPREPGAGKPKCVAGRFPAATPIRVRSTLTPTGKQSWSNGASMELVTLGRAAVPRGRTPIREGRTQLRKCCGSFAITLPPHAIPKLLDGLRPRVYGHRFGSQCASAADKPFHRQF
jgi:hypothetical protein